MPTTKRHKCFDCGTLTSGDRCDRCNRRRKGKALGPCLGCGAMLHRRTTPKRDRAAGSRYLSAKGRCGQCLKMARERGEIPAPEPRVLRMPEPERFVKNPQPRVYAKAHLTLEERARAACGKADDATFFSDDGSVTQAKAICQSCPIRERCLEVAMANNELFGVFGGLTAPERQRLRAARRRAAQKEMAA
jgi:WhiB family redox-sensing transcriptional regulator